MAKPFLTFQAQISFLEQDKNLLVEDYAFAEAMLKQIGYYKKRDCVLLAIPFLYFFFVIQIVE